MKTSLNKRMILMISSITIIICLSAFLVIRKGIGDVVKTLYQNKSIDISKAIAVYMKEDVDNIKAVKNEILSVYNTIDNKITSDEWGSPEFEAYLANYEYIQDMPEFKEVVDRLRKIQDVLDIDCAYLTEIDAENKMDFYIADAAYEDACPPGTIDPIYNIENSPLVSSGFMPNITNTQEYGWLITTGMPIYDDKGEVVCYAAIDISMNEIMALQTSFISVMAFVFIALAILLTFIAIKIFEKHITKPIKDLSQVAKEYKAGEERFKDLDIQSGDEIQDLAESIKKMETDVKDYIEKLEESQEQTKKMEEAANVDALTKVRNKRAYDLKVQELNAKENPYALVIVDLNDLKGINDEYGHDKGDIAIKTICRIICRVFKHSPVYRIGGDEFVVILQNSDLAEREALFKNLEKEIDDVSNNNKLDPWERVSAAYGFCLANEKDAPDVVFKNADAHMYINKKNFKSRSI